MTRFHLSSRLRERLGKLGLSLAVALLVVVITQEDILKLGILQRLELASIDYRFAYRGTHPSVREWGDVVIVEISEESFRSLPEKWPWPRAYYAHLVRNLRAAGASVVGIDLILSGRDHSRPESDLELRKAIRETGIVVLAGKTEEESASYTLITPGEQYGNVFFDVDSAIGLVNIRNDADGVFRRYRPFVKARNELLIPSFSFAVLNRVVGLPSLSIAENFSSEFIFNGVSIPKYDNVSMLINYYGPSGTFRRVHFADVIDDALFVTDEERRSGHDINTFDDPEYGLLHDGTFRNKIVLVGSTLPEDHDLFPVAVARGDEPGDNLMFGVELHANVIQNVLWKDFLTKQSATTEILAIALLTLITFLVTSALKGSKTRHHYLVELNGFLFATAEIFLIGFASLVLFTKYNYLLSVISPMVAVVAGYFTSTAYHFVVERKQRMLIKTMFSTYVNPSVVDELITNPEKLTLGGQRKELTVLFSDIENFTTISEHMPSEELVGLLNEYLSAMTDIIFEHDGTLDKFEGDAVMAFWGAPIPQKDHALRACRCALEMQRVIAGLRERWKTSGRPEINVRIGINTGEMVVGNMGGSGKFDYTVIGDSVNIASRLENANRAYRTRIMASQRTYDMVREHILGRELDVITVKGRTEPLRIYELLQPFNGSVEQSLGQFLDHYRNGLALYRERRWREARACFEAALALRPEDYPTHLFIERSRLYDSSPPPEGWNGVFQIPS